MAMALEVITRSTTVSDARPPLLFVHGTAHAAWCWDEHFLPWFAEQGFEASAVSLRGHGRSDGADFLRWASVADYVEDVRSVASALSAPPILVGHSLGGLVVQKYLERYEAGGAVLLAPSPARGMFWPGLRLFRQNPLVFLRMFLTLEPGVLFTTPARARRLLFSPETRDATVTRHTARLGRESFRVLLDMTCNLPHVEQIRKRRCPMLVIGAGRDALVPPRAVKATARTYNASLTIFPGMGHDVMLDDAWELVARRIAQWIREASPAAASVR
jgi:pimeloyl-ACP methyl ester carboxylesterase